MRAIGWILCGVAAAAILYAIINAASLFQLYRKLQRMKRYSDPENHFPLERGPWSIILAYPNIVRFLGIGILFGIVGGCLLYYY